MNIVDLGYPPACSSIFNLPPFKRLILHAVTAAEGFALLQERPLQLRELECLILDNLDLAVDGEVDFEVFTKVSPGEPWGQFRTTTDLSESVGPHYRVPGEAPLRIDSGSFVSLVKKQGEPWDTVLLARLRFPTDKEEPTSL